MNVCPFSTRTIGERSFAKKYIFGYVFERELAGNGFALPFENAEKEGRICVKNSVRRERRWSCWRDNCGAVALFFDALGISLSCNKMNIMLSYIYPPRDNVFRSNSTSPRDPEYHFIGVHFVSDLPIQKVEKYSFFAWVGIRHSISIRLPSPSSP